MWYVKVYNRIRNINIKKYLLIILDNRINDEGIIILSKKIKLLNNLRELDIDGINDII